MIASYSYTDYSSFDFASLLQCLLHTFQGYLQLFLPMTISNFITFSLV